MTIVIINKRSKKKIQDYTNQGYLVVDITQSSTIETFRTLSLYYKHEGMSLSARDMEKKFGLQHAQTYYVECLNRYCKNELAFLKGLVEEEQHIVLLTLEKEYWHAQYILDHITS